MTCRDERTGDVVVRAVGLTHPDAQLLVAEALAYLAELYAGDGDSSPFDPAQFTPPSGGFVVAYVDDMPAACGGWRLARELWDLAPGEAPAEIKRMYVARAYRRRGLGARVLAELERLAAEAGCDWAVLETGTPQPAAIAMYTALGYAPVAAYGHYRDEPDSVYLGRRLA